MLFVDRIRIFSRCEIVTFIIDNSLLIFVNFNFLGNSEMLNF